MNCGQRKSVLDSSKDEELRLPLHMNMYMVNCILINGNPLITKIIKHLKLRTSAHPMVERVLRDFCYCVKKGIEYKGERECYQWDDDKLLLSSKSVERKIIADIMEDSHGLRAAWQFVNEYR